MKAGLRRLHTPGVADTMVMSLRTALCAALCVAAISAALAMPESSKAASLRPELARHHDDRITWVPGFDGELPSRMYGG